MKKAVIPIFLAKLNAARQGHFVSIKVDYCIKILRLLDMFLESGVIRGYKVISYENKIKIFLKYIQGGFNIFNKVTLVSRPGRRVYVDMIGLSKLKEREGGTVLFILSTSRGIFFDSECLMRKLGGEVLIKIHV